MASLETENNLYSPESSQDSTNSPESSITKSASSSELADQETSAATYTPGNDDLNFTGEYAGEPTKPSKKFRNPLNIKRRRLLLIGGIAGGGGVVMLILLILFLAAFFKIPGLGALIVQQEFARLDRQFASNADRVTEEQLAVSAEDTAAGESWSDSWLSKFDSLRDNTLGRLDNYRPNIVIQNLEQDSGLKLNYDGYTKLGTPLLTGVELGGTEYPVIAQSFKTKFIPVVSSVVDFKNDLTLSRSFAPALEDSLEAEGVGPIIRFFVANSIRQKLGIGLIAWNLGKYQGDSAQQAEDELNLDSFEDQSESSAGVPPNNTVSDLENATNEANAQVQKEVENPQTLEEDIANNGVSRAVNTIINSVVNPDIFTNILQGIASIANPLYKIALPACIVYEGSLDQAGPSINNQTQAQEKAFYFLEDAGDEQKAGGPVDGADPTGTAEATAVGAMNAKLGDISQSNPYLQANNEQVNTSTSAASAEASPTGEYTLLNVAMPKPIADFINTIANNTCPGLTNVWTSIGVGAAAWIASIFIGESDEVTAKAAAQEATPIINSLTDLTAQDLVDRFVTNFINKYGLSKVGGFSGYVSKIRALFGLKSSLKIAGNVLSVSAATILAKAIVMSQAQAGGFYNGLEQGADYANEADSGANIQAGELERQQLFGRPLTCAEINQSDQADQQFIADNNQSQSLANRYLAFSNPDSLVSHLAMAVSTDTNGSLLNPIGDIVSTFTSGPFSFSSLIGALGGMAHADSSCADENYGNVQFGWSQSEENLISSNPDSYQPLENEQTFETELNNYGASEEKSGAQVEGDIANTYGACFGYQYNPNGDGDFDPTDPNSDLVSDITGNGSIGALLTTTGGDPSGNPYITRDSSGDVITNEGICSPDNLGPNNPQYGDLVFRWRLAMSYDTTLDQLTNMQTVSN